MILQTRFLSLDMTGDDVALLQRELLAIANKYKLTIPPDEVSRKYFGQGTRDAVTSFQKQNLPRLIAISGIMGEKWLGKPGVVDSDTAAAINQDVDRLPPFYTVSGMVKDSQNRPAQGVSVQAFDQDMRSRVALGTPVLTDTGGQFRIEYKSEDFLPGDSGSADLSFEVRNGQKSLLVVTNLQDLSGDRGVLTAAPLVLFNAGQQAQVIIFIESATGTPDNEYDSLLKAIGVVTNISPAEFTSTDIAFLTAEFNGVNPLVTAERLTLLTAAGALTKQAAQNNAEIPPAPLYGLGREGLFLDLATLALVPSAELLLRLTQAISARIIPADPEEDAAATVRKLSTLGLTTLLKNKDASGRSSLGELLSAAGLSPDEQNATINAYLANTGDTPEFWDNLRKDPSLRNPSAIDRLQYLLQLDLFSLSQPTVSEQLQKAYPDANTLRDLFRQIEPDRLRTIIAANANIDPSEDDDKEKKVADIAQTMLATLAQAYPTDAMSRLLPTLPHEHFVDEETHNAVNHFFDLAAATDFDLRTSRIDDLILKNPSLVAGLQGKDRSDLVNQVKRVQRLFRLSVNAKSAAMLLGTGLDSAHEIARIPASSFMARFGASFETPEQASQIYDRALTSATATEFLYTRLNDAMNGLKVMSVDSPPTVFEDVVLKTFPDLAQLFGSPETCECEDCRSVLSPAAYFVDLLEFLANSTPNSAGVTPLEVLVGNSAKGITGRRPDLPFIPLTCENTNTLMPFVDLVNEILESYVVLGKLDSITAKDTGEATQDELSANPQYTLDKAYDTVRTAVYPLTLPYDQAVDVLRVYLESLGSSRYDLLLALDKQDGSLPPVSEQAADYLGIYPAEFEVITGKKYDDSSSGLITTIPDAYGLSIKDFQPVLVPGATGLAVRALQKELNAAGAIPALTINDTFDAATVAAVKSFQTGAGISTTGIPDATTWNLLNSTGPDALEVFLSDVLEFLRRTSIQYTDLIELLKTDFVNPGFSILQFLEDHGISYADIDALAKTGFTTPNANILTALLDPALGMNQGQFIAFIQPLFPRLGGFIVLQSGAGQCDLSATLLVRLDGKLVGESTWYLINRFIRLWRRTGWTIRELDSVWTALGSTDINIALILSIAVTKRLSSVLKLPVTSVVALWADIETRGSNSLYERLFRSRAIQKLDDSFTLNPDRSELQVIGKIANHVPAIIAGLRISESDLGLIRIDAGLVDAGGSFAQMNLASLSLLYRYTILAAGLKMTIPDLLSLKRIIPFDPFLTSAFGPANTELFVNAARKVKASTFSAGLLRYLYLGEDNLPVAFEPSAESISQLLLKLRAGLVQISSENIPGEDATGERTRDRLGLLFEPAVADQAVRMIDTSAQYTAPLSGLPAGFVFSTPTAKRIDYDPVGHLLRFTGVMTITEQIALKALSASLSAALKPLYEKAIDDLYLQPRTFITNILGSQGIFLSLPDAEAAIFNVPAADEFGNPIWLDAVGKVVHLDVTGALVVPTDPPPVTTAIAAHFYYFLTKLLPFLTDQLSLTLMEKTLSASLNLSTDLTKTLLEKEGVINLQTLPLHPLADDLRMLEGDGLAGAYFSAPLLTGTTLTRTDPKISFNFSSGSTAPGGAVTPFSVRWTGFLLASTGGVHTFYLRSAGNVKLSVNGVVVIDSWAVAPTSELQSTATLEAGHVYAIQLDFSTLKFQGVIEWRWSSPSFTKMIIPAEQLYSSAARAAMELPTKAYRLLYKAATVVKGFNLSAAELTYFTGHKVDFDNFDLSKLPLVTSPPNPTLFKQWLHLYNYAAARDQLPTPNTGEGATGILGAAANGPNMAKLGMATIDAYRLLTGVDPTDAANAIGLTDGDLRSESGLGRLQAVLNLSRDVRVAPSTLKDWVTTAANLGPADDIRRVVKGRYDEATWPTIARPLSDTLRNRQRNALVDFLVAKLGLANSNQLYELLLIDVEMGTCMNTSRIVQAYLAVQLFINRCLLGAEDGVDPGAIDKKRWEWLSAYRVSEVNRQVYLFPENWLESAFRDDKTPFFTALESDLQQNDLTTDTAEEAFLNYLYKLDEVARLDLVGFCLQDRSDGNGVDDIAHLFGRTIHNPHNYFYRRRTNNTIWSPWENIPLDIEGVENGADSGVHLIPVIWNRRLYLFWPLFTERTDENQDFLQTESAAHKKWRADHDKWEKLSSTYPQAYATWLANKKAFEQYHASKGESEFYDVPAPQNPGEEPKEPQDDTNIQRPLKHLEITIAWSQYQGDGVWSPKQTTSQSQRCNSLDRKAYIFQAVPLIDGTLVIQFLAHPVTDDRWAHDPKNPKLVQEILAIDAGMDWGVFQFTGCQGDLETKLTYFPQSNGRLGIVLPDATAQDYMRFKQIATPGLVLNTGLYSNVRLLGDLLIQKNRVPVKLLNKTPNISLSDTRLSRFRLLYPQQLTQFVGQANFCYQDDLRDYYVTPEPGARMSEKNQVALSSFMRGSRAQKEDSRSLVAAFPVQTSTQKGTSAALNDRSPWTDPVSKYTMFAPQKREYFLFEPLFHPYSCAFIKILRRGGIDALLSTDTQRLTDVKTVTVPGGPGGLPVPVGFTNNFETTYGPTGNVLKPYPQENVDFSLNGSYSIYNQELFFHAVLLVANSLSTMQRFDEARQWYHYIFNPMTKDGGAKPARYWNYLPFKDVESDRLIEMMTIMSMPDAALTAQQIAKKKSYAQQWELLKEDPFRPFVVARLRPLAFMKNVVMKYINNLIMWGDQLFGQDTRESINEATQLYVLASELLGPLIQKTPRSGKVAPETYDSLKKKQIGGKLDVFSNGLVMLEQEFPFSTGLASGGSTSSGPGPVLGNTLYFCIPQNSQLLGYWDAVADRLFKIRNCLNIAGIARDIPLFSPAIDPALLVAAVAQGVDLRTVLNDLNTPTPLYRFTVMYQKAVEFSNDVKMFGAAVLAALEKRDAESLAQLRATQEVNIQNLMKEVRTQQLQEAQAAKMALDGTTAVIAHRNQYYANIEDRIPYEATQIDELTTAQRLLNDGQTSEQFASMIASYLPDTSVGISGNGAHFTAAFGRGNLIAQYQSDAHEKSFQSGQHSHASTLASILGNWMRRKADWKYQADQAALELTQVGQQIAAANIRIAIAAREMSIHEQQAVDAEIVETFLKDKFTDGDLYSFMSEKLATLYFQSYQLAFDLARKAEKAYRLELGLTDSNFIQYGYWNDLYKGLLAGENLTLALRQMERSYLDLNRRDYEITRNISLLMLDPLALMQLRLTGVCDIELPEVFFDADYPGHYMRRIKSVSLTIPAVAGPYTPVNCTLTLLSNKTRISPVVGDSYLERLDTQDDRFVYNFASIQSIATSSGQNDSGLFELNFHDERYLPFEYSGAVSRWRLEMPLDTNAFDFDTVTDVIVHLKYLARDAGVMVRKAARAALESWLGDTNFLAQSRLISLRHEFPTEWARFLAPTDGTAVQQELTLKMPNERFSFRFRGWQLHIRQVEILMPLTDFRDASGLPVVALTEYRGKPLDIGLSFLAPNGSVLVNTAGTLDSNQGLLGGTPYFHWDVPPQDVPVTINLQVAENAVKALKPALQTAIPTPAGHKRLNPDAIEDIVILLHFSVDR